MKIAIVNGPNLNLLGSRETAVYGSKSWDDFATALEQDFSGIDFTFFQSNVEGELIDHLQSCNNRVDGIILNAGGYTHTSVALADAVAAIHTPVVEVHISNVFAREEYRHISLLGKHCKGSISGFGLNSYRLAIHSFELND